jgi:hypothetical protein
LVHIVPIYHDARSTELKKSVKNISPYKGLSLSLYIYIYIIDRNEDKKIEGRKNSKREEIKINENCKVVKERCAYIF